MICDNSVKLSVCESNNFKQFLNFFKFFNFLIFIFSKLLLLSLFKCAFILHALLSCSKLNDALHKSVWEYEQNGLVLSWYVADLCRWCYVRNLHAQVFCTFYSQFCHKQFFCNSCVIYIRQEVLFLCCCSVCLENLENLACFTSLDIVWWSRLNMDKKVKVINENDDDDVVCIFYIFFCI